MLEPIGPASKYVPLLLEPVNVPANFFKQSQVPGGWLDRLLNASKCAAELFSFETARSLSELPCHVLARLKVNSKSRQMIHPSKPRLKT